MCHIFAVRDINSDELGNIYQRKWNGTRQYGNGAKYKLFLITNINYALIYFAAFFCTLSDVCATHRNY